MNDLSSAIDGSGVTRIGALVPLSRPGWVEAGRHLLAGLELGAAETSLELVVRDTAADPERAVAAMDEFARLGVAAVAGEYHSVVARAAAARADELGLPFLCSSAVLDALTDRPTDQVARVAPPQSRGWTLFAEHLRAIGHTRVAVAADASVYWAAGTRILRETLTVVELDLDDDVADQLVAQRATAVLLLVGAPEKAAGIVDAVRADERLAGVLIGAPAGQPELAEWAALLGDGGAAIPFLRYLPERLTALGARVEAALTERLGQAPSFVAFEGYDTMLALAERVRSGTSTWSTVAVEGTRGRIHFSRVPGISVWQWAWPPIQVVDRDPSSPDRFRVLRSYAASMSGTPNACRTPDCASVDRPSPGSSSSAA